MSDRPIVILSRGPALSVRPARHPDDEFLGRRAALCGMAAPAAPAAATAPCPSQEGVMERNVGGGGGGGGRGMSPDRGEARRSRTMLGTNELGSAAGSGRRTDAGAMSPSSRFRSDSVMRQRLRPLVVICGRR